MKPLESKCENVVKIGGDTVGKKGILLQRDYITVSRLEVERWM